MHRANKRSRLKKHWLALLAVATGVVCSSSQSFAAAVHVASCRAPSQELLSYGIGIAADAACLGSSSSDRACLNGPCRLCQKFHTKLSKGYLPCSQPIPLHKPVAMASGVDAATSSSPVPVKAVSPTSPSPVRTVVLTTKTPSPAPAPTHKPTTTSPKPTRAPAPMPYLPSSSPPAPSPASSRAAMLATTTPSPPAAAPPRPATTAAPPPAPIPAQAFDPELIDCRAGLTSFSKSNGVDAVLDLSCAVLGQTCLKTRRCETTPPTLSTLDATSCIDEFCRLCWVERTELSSRFLECKATGTA